MRHSLKVHSSSIDSGDDDQRASAFDEERTGRVQKVLSESIRVRPAPAKPTAIQMRRLLRKKIVI
jgi:hypothetical protein